MTDHERHTRTASYLAVPGEVKRVLLLYSGGLDTSVMLKWIQDEYEAEVVALGRALGLALGHTCGSTRAAKAAACASSSRVRERSAAATSSGSNV